jgi:hypothetical protein
VALANYTDLLAALAVFAERTDMTSVWPDLVRLAEIQAQLDCRLRLGETTVSATLTAAQDFLALPADCVRARTLRLDLDPVRNVDIVSPDVFAWYREQYVGDVPMVALSQGLRLYLAPTPVAAHPYTLWYEQGIPSLASSTTNWLLTNFPNVYLYGTLVQAAGGYLGNDERGLAWKALYDLATQKVRALEWRAKAGGGPLQMRPDRWA